MGSRLENGRGWSCPPQTLPSTPSAGARRRFQVDQTHTRILGLRIPASQGSTIHEARTYPGSSTDEGDRQRRLFGVRSQYGSGIRSGNYRRSGIRADRCRRQGVRCPGGHQRQNQPIRVGDRPCWGISAADRARWWSIRRRDPVRDQKSH